MVSLYKRLLVPPILETFLALLRLLNNLWEKFFQCSVIADFMSTMFGLFTNFFVFSSTYKTNSIICYYKDQVFCLLIWLQMIVNLFFLTFHWIIIVFFRKSNSILTIFIDKLFEFYDCQNCHVLYCIIICLNFLRKVI